MLQPSDINYLELLLIEKIEQNETWLLGERLGCPVHPKSPEVQEKVVEIVLECREQWRREFESRFGNSGSHANDAGSF